MSVDAPPMAVVALLMAVVAPPPMAGEVREAMCYAEQPVQALKEKCGE